MSRGEAWLFSRPLDLAVFGGSALLSFALLLVGSWLGISSGTTPDWAWVPAVLLVDVAHVWSTGFRVYFDRSELAKHPLRYGLVPLLSFAAGVALYRLGALTFWRAVAYLAIFHFIRQQYGFMALYRARRGDRGRVGLWVDTLAIYAATLYPLLYWHTHVPRRFDWLMAGDVVALPAWLDRLFFPLYLAVMLAYAARSIVAWMSATSSVGDGGGRGGSPGKDLLVLTTAACWYVGIVLLDSDYAFTVMNVFTHGIPYIALVFWWRKTHGEPARRPTLATFLATIWALAYVEELLWDRGIWGDRSWLFGAPWRQGTLEALEGWLVPLLAVPQITHYVLDGFLWRRRSDPQLSRSFSPTGRDVAREPGRATEAVA
jgi:hypothetical protein